MALIFLYMGVRGILFLKKVNKEGVSKIGKVVAFNVDGEGYKSPVIEYTNNEGILKSGEPELNVSSQLEVAGMNLVNTNWNKEVEISYEPENPDKYVIIEEIYENYWALGFVSVLGLVSLLIGISEVFGFTNFTDFK